MLQIASHYVVNMPEIFPSPSTFSFYHFWEVFTVSGWVIMTLEYFHALLPISNKWWCWRYIFITINALQLIKFCAEWVERRPQMENFSGCGRLVAKINLLEKFTCEIFKLEWLFEVFDPNFTSHILFITLTPSSSLSIQLIVKRSQKILHQHFNLWLSPLTITIHTRWWFSINFSSL